MPVKTISLFPVLLMQFNPGATFNEYLRSKHLIHTFQLEIKREAPSGFCRNQHGGR